MLFKNLIIKINYYSQLGAAANTREGATRHSKLINCESSLSISLMVLVYCNLERDYDSKVFVFVHEVTVLIHW